MTIEDVADKADAWSEAIKKIVKGIKISVKKMRSQILPMMLRAPENT